MCSIDTGNLAPLNWFSKELIRRKIRNIENVSFWHEVWFGDKSLKVVFPKLYSLAIEKITNVANMGWWDGDVWR